MRGGSGKGKVPANKEAGGEKQREEETGVQWREDMKEKRRATEKVKRAEEELKNMRMKRQRIREGPVCEEEARTEKETERC
ncbi:hypothetical protein PBY51_010289 [Eleginops maclovinus]|uniref:Uncharacterized protein n=1 Tax=Eleginops maclovinus TaxID=56733 RepID=A0AAN7XAH1_ELEMC|nr:hypothetical protein PBY51_010289 [Eleginops maclovinus]